MRGVYFRAVADGDPVIGSSPHARGLQLVTMSICGSSGIIPACAGFTYLPAEVDALLSDHPRMRGVYGEGPDAAADQKGSSPHARGLLDANNADVLNARIIPACAGFTFAMVARHAAIKDHPRMRGVYRSTLSVELG